MALDFLTLYANTPRFQDYLAVMFPHTFQARSNESHLHGLITRERNQIGAGQNTATKTNRSKMGLAITNLCN